MISSVEKKSKIRIALYEPRIPQNTGNIGRTCVGFDITLDLIYPLGFSIDDRYLKRAGLDYWKYLKYNLHPNFNKFKETINKSRILGFSKSGTKELSDINFKPNDILLFGREDIGLPEDIRNECDHIINIDMVRKADNEGQNGIRSLNLSVACGIASYIAIHNLKVNFK